jgi:hypothetical protein
MEFVKFINIDEIQKIKNEKNFIFFQFLTNLKEFVHVNTDIYVQFRLNNRGQKMKPNFEKLVNLFLNSPIYIGELFFFAKNYQKIYKDTRVLIDKIVEFNKIIYYKDILFLEKGNNFYLNMINDLPVIGFLRF